MIYSLSTGVLTSSHESAEKYFPIIAEAGFKAVDFNFDTLFGPSHIYKDQTSELLDLPEKELTEFFTKMKNIAHKNGVIIGQTHAPFPSKVFSKDEERNEYIRQCIIKCIKLTAVMECKYIVIHPVFGKYTEPVSAEKEFKNNIEFYSSLIPTLKMYNVTACLENMFVSEKGKIYGACCSDFYVVNRYIEELNKLAEQELFGFCFDSGHAMIVGADVTRAVNILGNNIKILHLHDGDGIQDKHITPFMGITDWDRVMNALKGINYSGILNFESGNGYKMFPKEMWPEAIALIGAAGRYFTEKYF